MFSAAVAVVEGCATFAFVCRQDYYKSYQRSSMKFCGGVWHSQGRKCFRFWWLSGFFYEFWITVLDSLLLGRY